MRISQNPMDQITITLDKQALETVSSILPDLTLDYYEEHVALILADTMGGLLKKIRHRAEVPRSKNRFTITAAQGFALRSLIDQHEFNHPLAQIYVYELYEQLDKQLLPIEKKKINETSTHISHRP